MTERPFATLKALACASIAILASQSATAEEPDFVLGAMTHFGCMYKGVVDENLSMLKSCGIDSPRDSMGWEVWEAEKGVYKTPRMFGPYLERCKEMGLKPLTLINHGNDLYEKGYPKSPEAIEAYAKFAAWVVASQKGTTTMFQVWNEWDGGCAMPAWCKGLGDAKSYAKLLAAAYPKMKAANPEAIVMANSVCTGEKFLEDTLKDGVLKSCDGIAFHAYNYFKPQGTPEAWLARMKGIEELIMRYNDGKPFPVYATEIGWPNHIGKGGRLETETGDYIARLYLLARTEPFIKGVWWYDFQDDGLKPDDNENNFGLVRPDLTPKDPYYSLKSVSHIVRTGNYLGQLKTGNEKVYALLFKLPDGKNALALWSALGESVDVQCVLKMKAKAGAVYDTYFAGSPRIPRSWGYRDWVVKRDIDLSPEEFQVTLRGRPFIIEGDLAGVEVARLKVLDFPQDMRPKRIVQQAPNAIGFALAASSSAPDKPINFGGPLNYRGIGGKAYVNAKDIDASFSLRWDKDFMTLKIDATDDVHSQDNTPADLWVGDSVQVAFKALGKDLPDGFSEYAIGLTPKGPCVYRESSQTKAPEGPCDSVKAEIKREGSKTSYFVKFPLKELGIQDIGPGSAFGFSLLLNDNDGQGRKGYLHWGDGIGHSKDPSLYNWIAAEE